MRARRWPVIVLLLSVLGEALTLWGCGAADPSPAPAPKAPETSVGDAIAVRVTPVVRRPLSLLYTTSATLRADKRATVIARTSGVIEKTLAEEGDRVAAGAPLAVLEDDEQRLNYEIAKATLETAERELERAETLAETDLISDEELDAKRRAAEEARRNADLARLALERTVIRAPFSGYVLTRHLDVGATVSNGTPVYEIADTDPLHADIGVPERQVASLVPGQEVRLTSGATGADVRGRIERIGRAVDPATGTVKVTVSIRARPGLRPGSFVRAAIVLDTHDGALVVPRSALVADGARFHVFRLATDGEHVEKIEVQTGYEEADLVEILPVGNSTKSAEPVTSGGSSPAPLAEGDRVVTTGASALSDGARVLLPEPPTAPAAGGESEGPGVRVPA